MSNMNIFPYQSARSSPPLLRKEYHLYFVLLDKFVYSTQHRKVHISDTPEILWD